MSKPSEKRATKVGGEQPAGEASNPTERRANTTPEAGGTSMWELRAEAQFHAAHKLNDYDGKCANLHGHTWRVVVWYRVDRLQPNGIGIDFGILKQNLTSILPDHQCLNEVYDFNPTAENLSQHIARRMTELMREAPARVEVWETDKNCAVYYRQP